MNNKEKGKSKAVMYIGIAIGAVIGAVWVGLVFNSVEIGGEKGLMMQTFALGAIFLAALIYGIVKKQKSMIAFSLCVPLLAGAAMFGAVNDFPRFIRRIQGEDFIGILFAFMGIVFALYFVIELIVCGISAKKQAKRAVGLEYCDGDLMLLQSFDRYRLIGYYLLKGRVHNVIKHTLTEPGADMGKMIFLNVNPDMDYEKIWAYREKHPQVSRIIDYIVANKMVDGEQIRISDVVYNVKPDIDIESEGGKFAKGAGDRIKNAANVIFWVAVVVLYLLAFTKLWMGIYNGKESSNLMVVVFFVIPALLIMFKYFSSLICNAIIKNSLVEAVIKNESAKLGNIDGLLRASSYERDFTPEEAERMLRAYALYKYEPGQYKAESSELHYATAIFSTIVAAQAAARAAAGGGGYGGCTSCGGGCSSCGGC
ncbi:MAG: hypothetical protein J6L81_06895, partial [Clostridia bacterium]|nr:hypothetical protein [Clostridia bacterium]